MKALACTASLLVALALVACDEQSSPPAPSPAALPGDALRGRAVAAKKCELCHKIDGNGGTLAPPMEESLAKVDKLLADYPGRARELAQRDSQEYARSRRAIEGIVTLPNARERFEPWLLAYLGDPKFDDPSNRMQTSVLTPQELADVVAWLGARRDAH
jgi:cytochrome c2